MKNDKRSYLGHDAEHKFEIEKRRKYENDSLRLMPNGHEGTQANNEKDEKHNNNKKIRKILRVVKTIILILLIVLIVGVLSAIIFELYLIPKGLCNTTLILGISFEVLLFLLTPILSRKKIVYFKKNDETWIEGMRKALKSFFNALSSYMLLHLYTLVVSGILVGWIIVKEGFVNDARRSCRVAVYAFHNEEVDLIFCPEIQTIGMVMVLLEKDSSIVTMVRRLTVSGEEKNGGMNLSTEDREAVCFEIGEYCISGIENPEEIFDAIMDFVDGQRKKERENIFDKPDEEGGAPSEIEGIIDDASTKENEVESFGDVEDILVDREEAYLSYPKATLAKLISNGYEMLALILIAHGGNVDDINYYYGQSILKDFEYLEFAGISDYNIKKRLAKISQKYKDLMMINPDWETKFPTIEKLKDGFQHVADQY